MVKKLKQMAEKKAASASSMAGGLFDSALAGTVKDSAQQIWLAGLGAFAKAQEEGGKVFEALVKEGSNLQKKTQGMAEDKISEVTQKMSKMSNMAGDVSAKAGQQWDRLESIFEERVSKALNKLGVPSSKDVDALIARIDSLSAQVAKMGKTAPSTKAASKAAPVKAAVKAATQTVKAAVKPATKPAAKTAAKTAPKRAPAAKKA